MKFLAVWVELYIALKAMVMNPSAYLDSFCHILSYKYNLQQQFGKPMYLMLHLMDNNSASAWGKQNFAYSINKSMAERHPRGWHSRPSTSLGDLPTPDLNPLLSTMNMSWILLAHTIYFISLGLHLFETLLEATVSLRPSALNNLVYLHFPLRATSGPVFFKFLPDLTNPSHIFLLFLSLLLKAMILIYWSLVDLQYCVSFKCIAKWHMWVCNHTYIYIHIYTHVYAHTYICIIFFRFFSFMKVKVTQLCPTLYVTLDYTVHGILQARILEWVAFPSPGDLPNPGIKPWSPTWQVDSLPAEPQGKPIFPYRLFKILSIVSCAIQ